MRRFSTTLLTRLLTLLAAAAVALGTLQPAAAQQDNPQRNQAHDRSPDDRIALGAQTVGALQSLRHSNNPGTLQDLTTSFQSAAGNLTFEAALTEGIDVYFEVYLSSPNHEGDVFDREGYLYVDTLPEALSTEFTDQVFKYVDLKAGHMELNYGDVHWYRSDVGQVQGNPLVGNYVVDPNTLGIGVELYGEFGPVYTMVGINNGATTGDFQAGRGFVYQGKLGAKLMNGRVRTSGSIYRVDHSENGPGYPASGTSSNLFSGNFSGSRYQAVLGGGGSAGQLFFGGGQDVTALQYDARVDLNRLMLMGAVGYFQDQDTNGSVVNPDLGRTGDDGNPSDQWTYYGATAQVDLLPERLYVAAQYSGASAQELAGVSSNGVVQRFQAGAGFWVLQDMLLLKGEYVTQTTSDFDAGTYAIGGIDAATEPEFSGVMLEVSASF